MNETLRRWNDCQGVIDLDSSQSSFLYPLLRVDKSKHAASKDLLDHFCLTTHLNVTQM